MSATTGESAEREQRLQEMFVACVEAAEKGQSLDRSEWLARYPEFAAELTQYFEDRDGITGLAEPLRALAVAALRPASAGSEAPTLMADGSVPSGLGPGTTLRYFGDYELLGEIARGGMGVVYKARQVTLQRTVALKMILAGNLASAADVQRFQAEAESAANLDHPHIVPIYEVGEHEGQRYFSMKLIDGGSLAQNLPRYRADPKAAARLLATLARTVHYAHQRGIMHRDLKPANILFDGQGEPLITDFGLAKRIADDSNLTHTGAILGTPSYMAPEQASGKKAGVTTAADIYSLGGILYELLTGRPPFRAETPYETVRQVLDVEPTPPSKLQPSVNRDLETICLKCLEKDPQRRYSSAAALADDLEHWLAGEPIQARPASLALLFWLWLRKNVRATSWIVFIGLLCGGLGSFLFSFIPLKSLFVNMAGAYEKFPNLTPPWLARDWFGEKHPLPDWLFLVSATLGGAAWAAMGLLTLFRVRARSRRWDLAASLLIGVLASLVDLKIRSPFFALGCALLAGMGLFVALLVKTKDRWSDLTAGIAVGLVAGVAAFTFGIGQAVIISTMVVNSLNDLQLLGIAAGGNEPQAAPVKLAAGVAAGLGAGVSNPGNQLALFSPIAIASRDGLALGSPDAHASDVLFKGQVSDSGWKLKGYPDLERIPPNQRGSVVFPKIVSDQVAGAFVGIWVGMLLSLIGFGGIAIIETMTAGHLLRSHDRVLSVLFPYFEVILASIVAGVYLLGLFLSLVNPTMGREAWSATALLTLLAALAIVGAIYRWPWPLRLLVYTSWLPAFDRLGEDNQNSNLPWYVSAPYSICLVVLLIYAIYRRRQASVAALSDEGVR